MTTLAPGVTVDRYRLLAPAGEGGQGSVWLAEDPLRPGTAVALKLLAQGVAPAASLERFRREARALSRLTHPSLPRCHALFEDLKQDVVGIALDFIEGSPLAVLLTSERLGPAHRTWVLRHLAAALGYIHEAGLVHRDVKPQNVMITGGFFDHPESPEGVKLVDFGIAAEPNNPKPITVTGSVIGTIDYLAPEILDRGFWKGPADGPERDVFALGVLAYELFHGKHPTGLGADAPLGDYLVAYRGLRGDALFPAGIAGDPLEAFYRGCLCLEPEKRVKDGAAAAALLGGGAPSGAALAGSREGLGNARTELANPSLLVPPSLKPRSKLRSFLTYSSFALGTAVVFATSFYLSYARPNPRSPAPALASALSGLDRDRASSTAEEPPDPPTPARPSRPASSGTGKPGSLLVPAPSGLPAQTHLPPAVFPASLSCPEDMVAVGGPPPFCLDKREVTVAEYRKCKACGPAKEAFWSGPSFTERARADQTQNCTENRTGLDEYPINCVSYRDASTYCSGVGKRLPHLDEWRKARSLVQLCAAVGGVCPLFEWTSDPTNLAGYRSTRGPSFRHLTAMEGSNIEEARNDDLGFRCARDPVSR